jgi:hypothetical protein
MPRSSDRHSERTRRRVGLELVQDASVAPAFEPSADLLRQLVAGVGGAGVWRHLMALQRIADENGGHRASPGPGYDASAEYVVAVLRAAGYQVRTCAYPLPKRRRRRFTRAVAGAVARFVV